MLDHWQAPDEVGDAIGCLTTTFTYEADFFQTQCLGRFLQLDNQFGETDELSFVIEQEERLAQVPVTVIVDRSYAAEPRNLRCWNVLPVRIPGEFSIRRSQSWSGTNSFGSSSLPQIWWNIVTARISRSRPSSTSLTVPMYRAHCVEI